MVNKCLAACLGALFVVRIVSAQEVMIAREQAPKYPKAQAIHAAVEVHAEKGVAAQPVKPVAAKPAAEKPAAQVATTQSTKPLSTDAAKKAPAAVAAKKPNEPLPPAMGPAPATTTSAKPAIASATPKSTNIVEQKWANAPAKPTVAAASASPKPVVASTTAKPSPAPKAALASASPASKPAASTAPAAPKSAVASASPAAPKPAASASPAAKTTTVAAAPVKKPETPAIAPAKKPETQVVSAAKISTPPSKPTIPDVEKKTEKPDVRVSNVAAASPLQKESASPSTLQVSNNSYDTAFTKLADGFDFPVGKPDAKNYYKARGFRSKGHLGEDWDGTGGGDTDLGDPIYCIGDGIVVFARDCHMGWGNVVIVRHSYREDGVVKNVDSLYGHLNTMLVRRGQTVSRGEKIATMGTAHGLYDAHLHLEVRKNLEIGMSRAAFAQDFSNYYDPTQFINAHRHITNSSGTYKVAMNTFTRDARIRWDKARNYSTAKYKGGGSESAANLKRALATSTTKR